MHKITFKSTESVVQATELAVGQLFIHGSAELFICLCKTNHFISAFNLNTLMKVELTRDKSALLAKVDVSFRPKLQNPYSTTITGSKYQIQSLGVREPKIGEFFYYNDQIYLRIDRYNAFNIYSKKLLSLKFWDFDERPVPIAEAEFLIN